MCVSVSTHGWQPLPVFLTLIGGEPPPPPLHGDAGVRHPGRLRGLLRRSHPARRAHERGSGVPAAPARIRPRVRDPYFIIFLLVSGHFLSLRYEAAVCSEAVLGGVLLLSRLLRTRVPLGGFHV